MSSTGTRKANGEGSIRKDGYVQIKVHDHPVAGARGLAFAHRVVLHDKIGPGTHQCFYCQIDVTWGKTLECDHKDHDKQNNDPENLVPCCMKCNRTRHNTGKTGCPREEKHGPYDKVYANGWRYCSKCKAEKEARRRARIKASD